MKQIRTTCCVLLLVFLALPLYADDIKPLIRKSPKGAVLRSLAGTFVPIIASMPFLLQDIPNSNWNEAVGIGLISSGILIGPGLGHRYSNNHRGFKKGVIIRAIGGALVVAGVSSLESIFDDNSTAEFLIVSGGVISLVSMIRDIATADGAARRYNERGGLTQVMVAPTYNPQTKKIGMNLSLIF